MDFKFSCLKEDDVWIGCLEEYPDYKTQGYSLEELKENLRDIYDDVTDGLIPYGA